MKEKLRVGGFYIHKDQIFEIINISEQTIPYFIVLFYNHISKRNGHISLNKEEMEEEFDILPPVMIELYVD